MGAAAVKTKAPVRQDPHQRVTDGEVRNVWKVINPDRTKHYVAVYENSEEFGVEAYEWMGYETVPFVEGGPRFLAGRTSKVGEPVRMRGHVLMAIDLDKKREIDAVGPDGVTGQRRLDQIDEQILDRRKGGIDPGRGLQASYIQFENNIQEAGGSPV